MSRNIDGAQSDELVPVPVLSPEGLAAIADANAEPEIEL